MRADLMRTAARMYYLEERSQLEVADRLGISRSSVSRLLKDARRTGVVTITVEPPSRAADLSAELVRCLDLDDAYVVPSTAGRGESWADLAGGLAQALDAIEFNAGDVLLTSWGQTIWEVTAHRLPPLTGATVAPMMAAADEPEPWFETNAVTRRVAAALNATPRMLHAPVHPTPALLVELLRDEETNRTLRLWDVAKAGIVNIGAPPMAQPDYGPAHHVRSRDQLARAVGDVASRYFDLDGQPVPYEDEKRFLGISREQIRAMPHRIGIAVGQLKPGSIIGAARARLITVVVTDVQTAKAALDLLTTAIEDDGSPAEDGSPRPIARSSGASDTAPS